MGKSDKFDIAKAGLSSSLEKLKKLNPLNAISLLKKSIVKAGAEKGSIWNKASVFFTSLFTGLEKIGVKQEEVSDDSAKKGETLTSKFGNLNKAVKGLDKFKTGSSKAGFSALNKVAERVGSKDGNADVKLTFEEMANAGALAFLSLEELKKAAVEKGGDGKGGEDALVEKFKEIEEGSAKTKLPLDKILSKSVFSMMAPKGDPDSKEYKDELEKRGKELLSRMPGMGLGDAMKAKDLLPQIGTKPMKDKSEVVGFVHKYIFRATSTDNVEKILDIIPDLVGSADKDTRREKLAKMVFLMDDKDFGNMVTLLIGEKKDNTDV